MPLAVLPRGLCSVEFYRGAGGALVWLGLALLWPWCGALFWCWFVFGLALGWLWFGVGLAWLGLALVGLWFGFGCANPGLSWAIQDSGAGSSS